MNFGDEEGRAAGIKLAGNLFLLSLTAGLADALALAKVHGIPSSDLHQLFNNWNPGAMAPARLKRITDAKFDEPSWELDMARKDAGLMLSAAEQGGINLMTVPAIAAVMDEWIAKGHGKNDWCVIAKDGL
jgi:3-hydroxyisobutyrate dehydrogenase